MFTPTAQQGKLLVVGLVSGLLSGLFGVGGGILIVPALVLLVHFPQKLAHGTSLAAVIPISLSGAIGYASSGEVHWTLAGLLAAGALGGALLGAWLLQILPVRALRYGFAALMVISAIRLAFEVPFRAGVSEIDFFEALVMIGLGLIVGTLSGLLGVGGGIIMVPALILLAGLSDLVAKGTSLLVIIPTGIVGTIANVRRGNADLTAAGILGVSGIASAYAGAALAMLIPARISVLLFAALLFIAAVQMVAKRDKG